MGSMSSGPHSVSSSDTTDPSKPASPHASTAAPAPPVAAAASAPNAPMTMPLPMVPSPMSRACRPPAGAGVLVAGGGVPAVPSAAKIAADRSSDEKAPDGQPGTMLPLNGFAARLTGPVQLTDEPCQDPDTSAVPAETEASMPVTASVSWDWPALTMIEKERCAFFTAPEIVR